MARRILILAAALALSGEVVLALWVAWGAYEFVGFGNGISMGGITPGVLQAVTIVLNGGMAALFGLGALILLLAAFGVVLNKPMQGVMMVIAALQLFLTVVITGLTGWMQFFLLGGVFVLLAAALAVAMVTREPPKPEPGPVAPAPGPQHSNRSQPQPAP
jgi:hypothetical protein